MVTVLTQPGCQPCLATERRLKKIGIPFEMRDVSTDPEAMALAIGTGEKITPIVIYGEEVWSGYRPDKIDGLMVSV